MIASIGTMLCMAVYLAFLASRPTEEEDRPMHAFALGFNAGLMAISIVAEVWLTRSVHLHHCLNYAILVLSGVGMAVGYHARVSRYILPFAAEGYPAKGSSV